VPFLKVEIKEGKERTEMQEQEHDEDVHVPLLVAWLRQSHA
jgi:hypothetical protein